MPFFLSHIGPHGADRRQDREKKTDTKEQETKNDPRGQHEIDLMAAFGRTDGGTRLPQGLKGQAQGRNQQLHTALQGADRVKSARYHQCDAAQKGQTVFKKKKNVQKSTGTESVFGLF